MPGANESSTVEWQNAHCTPSDVSFPVASKRPVTPTTALAFRSTSVEAGSSRSTLPALSASATGAGTASTSTLRPTLNAVFGLTPGPTPPSFSPEFEACRKVAEQHNVPLKDVYEAAQKAFDAAKSGQSG